jgi:diadenosine tetraphosphate (Ap4A) HIT family hydrolase
MFWRVRYRAAGRGAEGSVAALPVNPYDTTLSPLPMTVPQPVPSPFLEIPSSNWVASNELAFALRDRFPVSPGHTLVVPRRLVATYFDASAAEKTALWALVDEVKRALDEQLRPDGYDVGFNAGEAAGQTVLHLRIPSHPSSRSSRTRASVSTDLSKLGAKRRLVSGSGDCGLGGLGGVGFAAAHGVAAERDDVGVVDEAITDRVGDCRVSERLVPTFRGELRRDDGRAAVVAILRSARMLSVRSARGVQLRGQA